jgi:hypothetical protein
VPLLVSCACLESVEQAGTVSNIYSLSRPKTKVFLSDLGSHDAVLLAYQFTNNNM